MKKYQSHKIVEAGKIVAMREDNENPEATVTLEGGEIVQPSADWWERWGNATVSWNGGYYVRYSDGYDSWSPAEPFEEGYNEVP